MIVCKDNWIYERGVMLYDIKLIKDNFVNVRQS